MAARRPLFYRKEKPRRSVSKTGLFLCLLLAGGVMLVPASGDLKQLSKAKVRDWALDAGIIAFDDCVVTAEHALACHSHAVGTPLSVALRQIGDSKAQAAEEMDRRQKAEGTVRELALELKRVNAELKQAQAANAAFFPNFNGEVRPTGLSVTDPGSAGGSTASPHSARPETAEQSLSITPPSEED